MIPNKILPVCLMCIMITFESSAQNEVAIKTGILAADTIKSYPGPPPANIHKRFPSVSFVVPALCVAYGFSSLNNSKLKGINMEIKDEIYLENPHKKSGIDNYLQFTPAALVYGLNIAGIKGKNSLADRTMIYGISNIILSLTVLSLKKIMVVPRPDGSAVSSFPSGHTAEAFVSAEFLMQEYKGKSPWYGMAGYAIAAATGYMRMYNNKHWLGDVIAGAGIGIASAKISYWLYPRIKDKIFKGRATGTMVLPAYQNGRFGFSLVKNL
jgi:hypothetical protein